MIQVVPNGNYAYDASAKTITLSGAHASIITTERLTTIRNITRQTLLFDIEQLFKGSISVEDGVISGFSGDSSATDDDILQICYYPLYVDVQGIDGGTP